MPSFRTEVRLRRNEEFLNFMSYYIHRIYAENRRFFLSPTSNWKKNCQNNLLQEYGFRSRNVQIVEIENQWIIVYRRVSMEHKRNVSTKNYREEFTLSGFLKNKLKINTLRHFRKE